MRRFPLALMATGVGLALALSAPAQYVYPGGYGGWGGWSAPTTAGGDMARGAGVFAAGAGAYNQQTAEARSINAQTFMQMSSYVQANQKQRDMEYYQRVAAQQKKVAQSGQQIYQRIHDNPSPEDIHRGAALNVVMDDLTDPKNYAKVLEQANQPIPTELVKNIRFQYAVQGIAISLADIINRAVPDVLLTNPAFTADRTTFQGIAKQARSESETQGKVSPETLARARATIKAIQAKVPRVLPVDNAERREVDNFLKALFGLTKMLQEPNIAAFLKDLDKQPTTTLGHLIVFMHSMNLRFDEAKGPTQEATYDQLFPMLAALRDQVKAGGAPAPASAPAPDPRAAIQYFSGMHPSHFEAQPDPHTGQVPPAPAPGTP